MNARSNSKARTSREALLDAVEELVVYAPVSDITMRAIADEAGCALGGAYRYFATKEELIGATLDRAAQFITDGLDAELASEEFAREVWRRMAERPATVRLMAWVTLEQRNLTEVMSGHPLLAILVDRARERGAPDPSVAAAAAAVALMGPGIFVPVTNYAAGRDPLDVTALDLLAAGFGAIERGETTI